MQLKDKVAIVTGGAGGLGRAIAVALLQKGAKVCVFDIHEERGMETEESLQAKFGVDRFTFTQCDISNNESFTDSFQTVVSRHGNVDIMINNAAIVDEIRDIDKMILVNLGGTIRGSNLAIKHMRKDEGGKGGVIINVSSVLGYQPLFGIPSYVSTKHGIIGFTRSWASNPYLKDLDLRFGLLCPRRFQSNIIQNVEQQLLYTKEQTEIDSKESWMDTEDIAAGLIELLEDDDSNGVVLECSAETGIHRKIIEIANEEETKS